MAWRLGDLFGVWVLKANENEDKEEEEVRPCDNGKRKGENVLVDATEEEVEDESAT